MSSPVQEAGRWLYQGIWGVLVRWFRVPDEPPTLPASGGEQPYSFRPAPGFLSYLKLQFWIWLAIFDGAILFGWVAIAVASPLAGAILLAPALAVAVLPDIVVYIAVHLRYDTTWYVITQRSLRVRRGIWIIHETTITFENVQNIKITQGPVQRFFGIANVLVETAGGGGQTAEQGHGHGSGQGHRGLIEGVANAPGIRDLILSRLRESRAAGLGDDFEPSASTRAPKSDAWTPARLALLRDIRDAANRLAPR